MWLFRRTLARQLPTARRSLTQPPAKLPIPRSSRRCFASSGAQHRTWSFVRGGLSQEPDQPSPHRPTPGGIEAWKDILGKIHERNIDDEVVSFLRQLQRPLRTGAAIHPTRLTASCQDTKELEQLPGTLRHFHASDSMTRTSSLPYQEAFSRRGHWAECDVWLEMQAPPTLRLKPGAQVVLLADIRADEGLYKGARGVVTGFRDVGTREYAEAAEANSAVAPVADVQDEAFRWPLEVPVVRFLRHPKDVAVYPHRFEDTINFYDPGSRVPLAVSALVRVQVPLEIAWTYDPCGVNDLVLDYAEVDVGDVGSLEELGNALACVEGPESLHLTGDLQQRLAEMKERQFLLGKDEA